jgi:hypothetical protein
MAVLTTIVEGETKRLTFTLQADGAAFVGTGFTLSDLVITGSDNSSVDTTGDFGWVSAAAGTVYYDPDSTDFVAIKSPYRVRFKVTAGDATVKYFPSGNPDEIVVKAVR